MPIKAVGEKLDPHRHEAIAREENPDLEDGTIVGEIQRGYMWHDRIVRPARVRLAVVFALASVVAALIAQAVSSVRLVGVAFGADAILLAIAAVTVLRRVIFGTSEVDFRTILGAISVFTLLGLLFAFLYVAFAGAAHIQFFTSVAHPRSSDYLFFSYTTLTTTGYGNLVPAGTVGQSFAVFEMLIGQIFLVTLVAGLVSLWRPGVAGKAPVDPTES